MADGSRIEWTQATWNPVTGCSKVSPGCAHCYAETFAERWRGTPGHPYEQGFDLRLWPERLHQPLKWKRPRLIFSNSMSDLFHEDVPDEFIGQVFEVMVEAKQHVFQVLTKRHKRLAELAPQLPWPTNVWMGVSIENKRWVRTGRLSARSSRRRPLHLGRAASRTAGRTRSRRHRLADRRGRVRTRPSARLGRLDR